MIGAPNPEPHRRRLQRRMTATVELSHLGPSEWDEELEQMMAPNIVDWTGPAHVRPASADGRADVIAADPETVRRYDVWLPHDADPTDAATTLTVVASAMDPRLAGVPMSIIDRPLDDWQLARRMVTQIVA